MTAGWTSTNDVTVTSSCSGGCDVSMTFAVTFTGYDGTLDNMVVSPASAATAAVATVTKVTTGTEVIGGSFTLSFNDTMSVDMPYDVSATEMKAALDDLPGVGTVSVSRATNGARGGYSWTVTFDATAGNLPLLYATAGRLTPLDSNVAIAVSQQKAGSDSVLVYDGTGISDVRTATINGLISDMTYAFKVAPINSIGDGVLSAASVTVVTSSGASATYTTASGSSLVTGITYNVDEEQVITAGNCAVDDVHTVSDSDGDSITFTAETSPTEIETLFVDTLGFSSVTVQYVNDTLLAGQTTTDIWRVTFHDMGDVSMLTVSSACTGTGGTISIEEFLKGNRTEFTIEPKKASGDVLRDVTTADGFTGADVFLTETYFSNGTWYADQGVSTYNGVVYTVQSVTFQNSATGPVLYL